MRRHLIPRALDSATAPVTVARAMRGAKTLAMDPPTSCGVDVASARAYSIATFRPTAPVDRAPVRDWDKRTHGLPLRGALRRHWKPKETSGSLATPVLPERFTLGSATGTDALCVDLAHGAVFMAGSQTLWGRIAHHATSDGGRTWSIMGTLVSADPFYMVVKHGNRLKPRTTITMHDGVRWANLRVVDAPGEWDHEGAYELSSKRVTLRTIGAMRDRLRHVRAVQGRLEREIRLLEQAQERHDRTDGPGLCLVDVAHSTEYDPTARVDGAGLCHQGPVVFDRRQRGTSRPETTPDHGLTDTQWALCIYAYAGVCLLAELLL